MHEWATSLAWASFGYGPATGEDRYPPAHVDCIYARPNMDSAFRYRYTGQPELFLWGKKSFGLIPLIHKNGFLTPYITLVETICLFLH